MTTPYRILAVAVLVFQFIQFFAAIYPWLMAMLLLNQTISRIGL